MATRSWELRNGKTVLGTLSLIDVDQPWFRCQFSPGAGWEQVRELFEAQAEAVESGDQARMLDAIGAVRNLPLQLHPQGDDEAITPVMIQIRAEHANFRY
ncbi:hypothetical protein [Streptomyces sp. MBT62]|uniref:hypothetical protein n=1 Tax=Streptomyces sp. MBT62 TaxID=2800410 RepID=UPI0019094631|nr:hypothetical protein [Streptomyces sp. MBT62]MBK3563713.1 hypothetical protein [Streptomyces sp. MBT62]